MCVCHIYIPLTHQACGSNVPPSPWTLDLGMNSVAYQRTHAETRDVA